MLTFPKESAIVLMEQRGFEHISDQFFPERPAEKQQILENEEFLKTLFGRYEAHSAKDADLYLQCAAGRPIRSILDIGCGIAAIDALMYQRLTDPPQLYLLDGSGVAPDDASTLEYAHGGYVDEYVFTFRPETTRRFLIDNGVRQDRINFVAPSAEAIANLRRIDLVVSRASWGNHYPLSTYWEGVKACLDRYSTVVIDLREGQGQFELLKENFDDVRVIGRKEGRQLRVVCREPRWLRSQVSSPESVSSARRASASWAGS